MFGHMLWGQSLKFRIEKQALHIVGTSNQPVPVAWPVNELGHHLVGFTDDGLAMPTEESKKTSIGQHAAYILSWLQYI